MSNYFKAGLISANTFKSEIGEPFVLDVSKKFADIDNNNSKIIRPLEEKQDDKEDNSDIQNQELLNDAMELAENLRSEARENANSLIEQAKAEAEQIKEEAYNEGYEKGLSDGAMEAAKRGDAYIENLQKEHELFLEQINEETKNKVAESEKELVDFTCKVIEKFTGILVDDYKSVLLYMMNNAISDEEASTKFVIKVSEENYDYVYENKKRITGATNPNIDIEIFGDAKLENRQCIIETDNGIIDLSMNIQIENLITAIKLITQ